MSRLDPMLIVVAAAILHVACREPKVVAPQVSTTEDASDGESWTSSIGATITDASVPTRAPGSTTSDLHAGEFPPSGVSDVVTPTLSYWRLRAWPALGRVAIMAMRRMTALVDTPPDPPTRVHFLTDGICRRDQSLERGLPLIGALDLNLEPDRLFGVQPPTRTVTMRNYHLGDREVVGLGGRTRDRLWLVTSRHDAEVEVMGASDYLTWSKGAWRHQAATKRRGVNWPFAAEAGDSVFVAERDAYSALAEHRDRTRWRIQRLRGEGLEPLLAPGFEAGRCAHTRVTGLYGFANGDLLATGATCQDRLLLERWPSGSATSVAEEIPEITTNVDGGGYYIDVVSSTLVRVRLRHGGPVTITFDGTWTAAHDHTPLRQDRLLDRILQAAPDVLIDEAVMVGDIALVAGARGAQSFLLSDTGIVEPCHLVLPGR